MKFRARILVSLKEGVLDTQGKAVLVSLKNLGFDVVEEVRIGKSIEIVLSAGSAEEAEKKVESMCEALLVNPLIETGRVSLEAIG
ncbi:MAG: phosphoribosylformylglycinamidine synthase subunit PurS [Synergistaceae bacterium]|jgi:phosphoribosylformylglycinamidine synthase PurS subunit|nr:phosphoribosylformylglycinamidine synthase subunit PurS [Synergistaceae bacterium]